MAGPVPLGWRPGPPPHGGPGPVVARRVVRHGGWRARESGGSDEVGELLEQRGLRLGPHDLLDDLAAGEHVQRGDQHDPVLLRGLRVLLDVQLDHVNLVTVLLGDRLEHRGDLTAWAAPFGPVVDDDRLRVLHHLGVEVCVGHDLGCAHGGCSFRCYRGGLRLMGFEQSQDSWSAWSASHRSASIAAAHPVPAAVTAWRYVWSTTSPQANTPSKLLSVPPRLPSTQPRSSSSSRPMTT